MMRERKFHQTGQHNNTDRLIDDLDHELKR